MSHFTVYVFQDKNSPSVDEMLAPYDEENTLDEPVIAMTKDDAVARCRRDIERVKNGVYKEYLEDPDEYEKKWGYNEAHIEFLKNDFPKRLKWTDDECYEYEKSLYDDDMIDEDGNLLTTSNPNAKWDWYEEGGRWHGNIVTKNGDNVNRCFVGNIDLEKTNSPFAIVTPEGEWIEKGQMGWWGMTTNEMSDEEWDKKFFEYVSSLDKDISVVLIDCHI